MDLKVVWTIDVPAIFSSPGLLSFNNRQCDNRGPDSFLSWLIISFKDSIQLTHK